MHFHGSYLPNDVDFLLSLKNHEEISIEEKEDLLLNHKVHYSETLTKEMNIDEEYLSIFFTYHELNKTKICQHILTIAYQLTKYNKIVLVSLARAGTPYGVILKRILNSIFEQQVEHYSISIIKDRGLDTVAINHILLKHGKDVQLVYIDGWTGFGNIANELNRAMADRFPEIGFQFITISDIAGVSDICSSREDYMIPSCLLNATISGLISRTLINADPTSFHSVKYFTEKQDQDYSLWYIDELEREILDIYKATFIPNVIIKDNNYRNQYLQTLEDVMGQFNLSENFNLKPGTGETIRCLIRRNPELVIISDMDDPQIKPIVYLCKKKNVPISIMKNMELKSVGIIKKINL
jgi:hypothetical protein